MLQPERVQTDPGYARTIYAYRSTNGTVGPWIAPIKTVHPYVVRREVLDSVNGIRGFNPCMHYLRYCSLDNPLYYKSDSWYSTTNHSQGTWKNDPWPTPFIWDGTRLAPTSQLAPSSAFGNWQHPVKGLPVLFVDSPYGPQPVGPTEAEINSYISRSLDAMLPGIRPSMSLINSLLELKDIRTAGRSYDRINAAFDATERLKTALGLSRQAVKLLTGSSRRNLSAAALRSVLKAGSDSYLQAQFNIAPLLRDIQALRDSVASARRQLKTLIDGANKPQVRHYRCTLSGYGNTSSDVSYAYDPIMVASTVNGKREVVYPVRSFNATMEFSYRLWPGLYRVEDYLPAALGDVLGANWNPAIIWNAIPWSFVVDWVVGVGRWLDQFKRRNIEPVTSISRYCYSIHIKRDIKISCGEGLVVPMARCGEEVYIRKPHRPNVLRSIESNGLNLKEFSLAGALALSR